MANCDKYCSGPKRTNLGLVATNLDKEVTQLTKRHANKVNWLCPIGCTTDPKDKNTALNVIQAGGRHSICHRNPWRYAGYK